MQMSDKNSKYLVRILLMIAKKKKSFMVETSSTKHNAMERQDKEGVYYGKNYSTATSKNRYI